MELVETSTLLGYVVAADYDNETLLLFDGGCPCTDEVVTALRDFYTDWSITRTDNMEIAKTICNNDDISYQIDCVSGKNV